MNLAAQLLETGAVAEMAPLPYVDDTDLKQAEVAEGSEVALIQRLNCSVAFAKVHTSQLCSHAH